MLHAASHPTLGSLLYIEDSNNEEAEGQQQDLNHSPVTAGARESVATEHIQQQHSHSKATLLDTPWLCSNGQQIKSVAQDKISTGLWHPRSVLSQNAAACMSQMWLETQSITQSWMSGVCVPMIKRFFDSNSLLGRE